MHSWMFTSRGHPTLDSRAKRKVQSAKDKGDKDVRATTKKFSNSWELVAGTWLLVAGSLLLVTPLAGQQRDSMKIRREPGMYPKVWINGEDVSGQ
jgi:hypothetical protein